MCVCERRLIGRLHASLAGGAQIPLKYSVLVLNSKTRVSECYLEGRLHTALANAVPKPSVTSLLISKESRWISHIFSLLTRLLFCTQAYDREKFE